MTELIEMLKGLGKIDGLVATIVTGVFTFFITKYTYYKNIPLDKYEIAYNRVYYPIYHFIYRNECSEADTIVKMCEGYLNKYTKYVDKSTLRAFRYLKSCSSKGKKKAYDNFKRNIYAMDTKLRRRLGYLESNIFTMYTYSSPSEKKVARILLEMIGAYIPAVVLTYISNEKSITLCVVISLLFFTILIIEALVTIVTLIIKRIGRLLFLRKNRINNFKVAKEEKKKLNSRVTKFIMHR